MFTFPTLLNRQLSRREELLGFQSGGRKETNSIAYYCLPEAARYRQMEVLKEMGPDDLMLIASATGVLAADYSEEFCLRMFEEPESIEQVAEDKLKGSLEVILRFHDLGAGAVFTASDIADNSGPFFNPSQMERWIFPFLQRWSDSARNLGLFSILHNDGNIASYMDRLAVSGVDAIQAIDPVAEMDIEEAMKVAAGRVCLCGNIDCGLLLTGTPDQVFESTRRLLAACGSGVPLSSEPAMRFRRRS